MSHKNPLQHWRPRPGSELHNLIFRLTGEKPDATCDCGDRIIQMDCWGPSGCQQNIEEISAWLVAEARKRGWVLAHLPGADIGAAQLVHFASWLAVRRFLAAKLDMPPFHRDATAAACEAQCLRCKHFDPDSPGCDLVAECERIAWWDEALQGGHCLIGWW